MVTLSPSTRSSGGQLDGAPGSTGDAVELDDVADGDLLLAAAGADDRVHPGLTSLGLVTETRRQDLGRALGPAEPGPRAVAPTGERTHRVGPPRRVTPASHPEWRRHSADRGRAPARIAWRRRSLGRRRRPTVERRPGRGLGRAASSTGSAGSARLLARPRPTASSASTGRRSVRGDVSRRPARRDGGHPADLRGRRRCFVCRGRARLGRRPARR